ncbi:type III secretion apparatus lipoprotein, YscJ/HrcJ family [Burkholderia sp. Ch1-1]|uniref:Lipoprotein n=1 Tax=Paraburkholderia dioscoreae TaxID=2604047 RepID=A0A5Q4YSV1_9BURK|nr:MULTISPECIES: type III secretion inner membrane ring lipoprotein SctJ [Paraburkholderia]EIF32304.1 type III secretion apparatus lipoprotein, YscJ/HrcJ family [Burkholderia sp. Ch1-1]MDR8402042.1 type III secretion inner membrane ring lipoprotein SctJ [Paraburkholderia sp. USG1]VVD27873.1 type III secretion apparatus lipoprotein, YscJ/HrcJ family [Paraburkholderia dioscoreae]
MRRALILLPVLLFLVGCRTSLFEGLDEDQANRIVAALSHHGINGYKERNPDRTWNITVDDEDAVIATELASAYALPRGGHANLGDLFSRQGLISSPEEDRVRYVYGLSQELSETLEKMDGVLLARVHIVLPEKDPMDPAQDTLPSASVMMRYRSDYNLEPMRDRIRALVAGGVEGLTPARVSLTLVAVTPVLTFPGNCAAGDDVAGAAGAVAATTCPQSNGYVPSRATAMLVVLALLVLLMSGSIWLWDSGRRTWFKPKKRADAADGSGRAKSAGHAEGDA